MYRQLQDNNVRGGRGYSTELAGRDRFKFFRRPVEAQGALPGDPMSTWGDNTNIRFASSCPGTPGPIGDAARGAAASTLGGTAAAGAQRPSSTNHTRTLGAGGRRGQRAKPHHLPSLHNKGTNAQQQMSSPTAAATLANSAGPRDAAVQTKYREGEAQTLPYTPDYFIPEGAPEPEILALLGLTYAGGGLPAGKEEVELIQRVRRRRAVEAALPTGKDAESIEKRYAMLHEVEEEEWAEREQHVEKLQARRLERIQNSLLEREAARETANRERLDNIKAQYMETLRHRLNTVEAKGLADSRRAVDKKLTATAAATGKVMATGSVVGGKARIGTTKRDLIESYVKYGREARPPLMEGEIPLDGRHAAAQSKKRNNYDVRPELLTYAEGVEEVDSGRAPRIERVNESAFTVPENEAIDMLPTLYQRHEAQRVVDSLEYAHRKIHGIGHDAGGVSGTAMSGEDAHTAGQRVIDLYRATPKLQRPDTPELELDGDEDEDQEEACTLLQRLLRGRAVQNDFFEGKERCRGLIEELQAASNAKYAERSLVNAKEREEMQARQRAMVQAVLDAAQGDIVGDTLGYLFQELGRQQDIRKLDELRAEAEAVRAAREAEEVARRETERATRDREEVQYVAYTRATDATVDCFLQDMFSTTVAETALAVAVEAERTRQAALPPPCEPSDQLGKENLVCDMLDGFVVPTIVDAIQLQEHERIKQVPAASVLDVVQELDGNGAGTTDS